MNTYKYCGGYKLPDYLKIGIDIEEDSKVVYCMSEIHVNKCVKLSFCFSTEFSDDDILNDVDTVKAITARYGLTLSTQQWSI